MTAYVLLRLYTCLLVTCSRTTYGASLISRDNDIIQLSTLLYTADHSVTSLGVLMDEEGISNKTLFFIEADINEHGERVDYGLYVLKNGSKTKLLDSARDIAVVNLATAYFATKNGIYYYNKQEGSAQKYGSIKGEIISIAAENGTGVLYCLNKQHQLYKLTEDGRKSDIIDAVKNAQEIVTDNAGHLFYYLADKTFYMYDGNNVRKIEGVPDNMKKVRFVKTPLVVENYALFNGDDYYYGINSKNATVVISQQHQKYEVSAVSIDAGVVIYFSKDKKIYEFNILERIVEGIFKSLSEKFKRVIQAFQYLVQQN